MGKPLKISEEAAVQMPMKTVASLIAMVAIGTWAYFGIIETQNRVTTQLEIMSKDLEMNTEFRIKWPRGQMGSLPADQEQFMMIEDLYKTVDRINKAIEDGMHNKVNIEFLTKQMNESFFEPHTNERQEVVLKLYKTRYTVHGRGAKTHN